MKKNRVAEVSMEIAQEAQALARFHGSTFIFGAINFGGKIGAETILAPVAYGVLPVIPKSEVIPYTDFGVALRAARDKARQFRQVYGRSDLLIIVVTNGEPWLAKRMSNREKQDYFWGAGDYAGSGESPLRLMAEISNLGGEVFLVGVDAARDDVLIWNDMIHGRVILVGRGEEGLAPVKEFLRRQFRGNPSLPPAPIPTDRDKRDTGWGPGLVAGVAVIMGLATIAVVVFFKQRAMTEQLRRKAGSTGPWEEKKGIYFEALRRGVERKRRQEIPSLQDIIKTLAAMFRDAPEERRSELIESLLDMDQSPDVAQGMANVLRDNWLQRSDRILPEISVARAMPRASDFLEALWRLDPMDSSANSRLEIRNAIHDLALRASELSRSRNHAQRCHLLRRYRQDVEKLSNFGVLGAHGISVFYERLLSLLESPPFGWRGNFEGVDVPHSSLNFTQKGFALVLSARGARDSIRRDLLAFIDYLGERPALPEGYVLHRIVQDWIQDLENRKGLLDATVVIEPSLDLDESEENIYAFSSVISMVVRVLIENRGILAVSKVALNCRATGGVSGKVRFGSGTVDLSDDWMIDVAEEIASGERVMVRVPICYERESEILLRAMYLSDGKELRRSEHVSLRLLLPVRLGREIDLKNNFEWGFPLVYESKERAWGVHGSLVKEIIADPALGSGRLLAVWGSPWSGKTTILKSIEQEMRQGADFLPVYVNLRGWFLDIYQSNEDHIPSGLSVENLYFELADAARSASCRVDNIDDKLLWFPLADAEEISMAEGIFCEVVGKLGDTVSRRICFLIDELDWWIKRSALGAAEPILKILFSIAKGDKGFSVIVAHSRAPRALFVADELALVERHVSFLSAEDVKDLVRSLGAPLSFTDFALEYLWRVTGGWPGLLQLICARLVEGLREAQELSRAIIDEAYVKASIREILVDNLRDRELEPLKEGFEPNELDCLCDLAVARRDLQDGYVSLSSLLSGPLEPIWSNLVEKQAFSRGVGGGVQLRVGLLAYPDFYGTHGECNE